jgi:peptidyl-prolyl cis-trans isomerase D
MLQAIRDKITGWIATIFLGAIAVVFVFWGINFRTTATTYAAKVNGDRIPVETARRAWQQRQQQLQQMLRSELPAEMATAQQRALLDQLVRQKVLLQRAEKLGYRVSEAALASRVRGMPEFQVDGAFSGERYNLLLRQVGLSSSQFEADLSSELLLDQLQNGIVDSAFVTQAELDRRYALEKQEREVDYALIAAGDFAAGLTITDEQLQKWYDEHKSEFMTTEKVDFQYLEVTHASAEAAVQVTEEGLKDFYEQVKDRYESPERRHARHILINVGDGVDDAAALKKATELTAKAKGGADFGQLAKEDSQDAGSASQGGDLGWAERGLFVGPLEDALFSMSTGEIRGPVKGDSGYHIIKLDEIEAGHKLNFDEARQELEAEYRKERAQSIFSDESQKLADTAFASLTELDSAAKALSLPLQTVTGFTRQGGGEFGADPGVIEAVFSDDVLERRENSPLVTVGEDRAVVLRVTNHAPPEPRPMAEVRDQIQSQVRTKLTRDAAAAKGNEALERLRKGESWATVASSQALKPVGRRFINRQDAVAPQAVVRGVFAAPQPQISEAKPYYAGLSTDDGNFAVIQVTNARNAQPSAESAADKEARKRRAEQQAGSKEYAAYIAEAERNSKIVKNPTVFE